MMLFCFFSQSVGCCVSDFARSPLFFGDPEVRNSHSLVTNSSTACKGRMIVAGYIGGGMEGGGNGRWPALALVRYFVCFFVARSDCRLNTCCNRKASKGRFGFRRNLRRETTGSSCHFHWSVWIRRRRLLCLCFVCWLTSNHTAARCRAGLLAGK